jgi:hypothetical protein
VLSSVAVCIKRLAWAGVGALCGETGCCGCLFVVGSARRRCHNTAWLGSGEIGIQRARRRVFECCECCERVGDVGAASSKTVGLCKDQSE